MLPYSSSSPSNPSNPSEKPATPAVGYEPPTKPRRNILAIVVGSVLGLIALAGLVFAVYYIFFRQPPANIALQTSHPDQVLLGEPFKFTVAYTNSSDEVLSGAVVSITVPEGMAIVGVDPSTRLTQQVIGDLSAQGIGSTTFDLVATSGENSVKRVSVAFRYRLGDSQTPAFERLAEANVSVGGPAVTLNFDVPENVFAGQVFDMGLSYRNNSQTTFQNARLVFDYPQVFELQESASSSVGGNNEFDLGMLEPGEGGTVTVSGRMTGGQQTSLGVRLQLQVNGHAYDVGSKTAAIGIQTTPLSISISVNRQANYVASLGEALSYTLNYHNGSVFALQNVVVRATLEGEMFDIGTVGSQATLDSVSNTLTWDTATTPRLASVAPGESGSVDFRVNLKKSWPIQDEGDKDFAVRVRAGIQSLTVPPGITAEQTMSSAEKVTSLAGQAAIASLAYFREPSGSVENLGPYPPRVDQATQYTIHWQVRNYSTDISSVRLSAVLQSGARMVKVVSSSANTSPIYNSQTGQVTWDIPRIAAGSGVLSGPVEAIFQIEATPGLNQAGRDIPLITQTSFSAVDAFTGITISGTAPAKDSSLPDDNRAASGNRRVQP